nr:cytochrome c-type biogenesis protein [Psychrobacter sp. I-STPA6b]
MMMLAVMIAVASVSSNMSMAAIDVYEFDSPQQEAQYRGLIDEFRCPKCQNQNLAGSDAPIAQDLKQKTYEMVKAGQTDAQIREYMYDRYGDFISYKPPVRPSTWILWFFPPILLLFLIVGWLWKTKRQHYAQRLASQQTISAQDIENSETVDATAIMTDETQEQQSASSLSKEEAQQLKELLSTYDDDVSPPQDKTNIDTSRGDK